MDTKQVTFTMRLEADFHKKVRMYAFEKGVSVKKLFVEYMNKLIAEEEAKKK